MAYKFPAKFQFKLQFFNFNEIITDPITYQQRSEKDERNASLLRTRGKYTHPLHYEAGLGSDAKKYKDAMI